MQVRTRFEPAERDQLQVVSKREMFLKSLLKQLSNVAQYIKYILRIEQ